MATQESNCGTRNSGHDNGDTDQIHRYRIVISRKESEKMKVLETKLADINVVLKQNMNNMSKVLEDTQEMDAEIENVFKTFRNKLNEKEKLLRQKLTDTSNKQLNELKQQQENLKKYTKSINVALNQQNALVLDPKLNSIKRETQISEITDNTLDNLNDDHIKFEMQSLSLIFDTNEINQCIDYISSIGKLKPFTWSRTFTYDIPEHDLVFNIELEGESKELVVGWWGYHNINLFNTKILNAFNKLLKRNEQLILTTDGNKISGSNSLRMYASNLTADNHQLLVYGYIHKLKFNDLNIVDGIINIIVSYDDDRYVINGEIVLNRGCIPRQTGVLTTFDGVNKSIKLRNNLKRNLYEYTMDCFKAKCIKKFARKNLKHPFVLRTYTGETIKTDNDIITYLAMKYMDVELIQM